MNIKHLVHTTPSVGMTEWHKEISPSICNVFRQVRILYSHEVNGCSQVVSDVLAKETKLLRHSDTPVIRGFIGIPIRLIAKKKL